MKAELNIFNARPNLQVILFECRVVSLRAKLCPTIGVVVGARDFAVYTLACLSCILLKTSFRNAEAFFF